MCPGHTTMSFNKLFQSRICQADQSLPEKLHTVFEVLGDTSSERV
jgi:hypothetical protein